MPNDEHSSAEPSARKREPMPWFPLHVAKLATARGYSRVISDDAGTAALFRFMLHAWVHGPVADGELEDVCGAGASLLAKHMLRRSDDGATWTLPELEQAREECEAFRSSKAEAGRKGAEARLAKLKHIQAQPSTAQAQLSQDRTGQDSTEESEQTPPPPLQGGEPPSTPVVRTPRRKPAEPWQSVIARIEFAHLRQSPTFARAWAQWIEHTRTAGAKAREPSGLAAATILNTASREGPDRFAAAVERSIAGNWQGIHYPDARGATTVTRNGFPASKTDQAIEAVLRQGGIIR